MKKTFLLILFSCLLSSCSHILQKNELFKIQEKQIHMTGYHSLYLGSDDNYHFIKVGNIMGAKIYRIKIEEFNINNSYSYNFDSPKAIPLHKYIKKQL